MLVLALDTATPAVTAGVVELSATPPTTPSSTPTAPTTLAVRVAHDARRHAELLLPLVREACAAAGVGLADVDAVVVGTGPGPFTGLRVGMVTAAALGDGLGVPVHGVCTLDAIARDAGGHGALLVATDARRREVYWARYAADGRRVDGPHVGPAAGVDTAGAAAAAGGMASALGLPVVAPASPSPAGLVAVAADALCSGAPPAPLEPRYLRRPDAVETAARKPVTTP